MFFTCTELIDYWNFTFLFISRADLCPAPSAAELPHRASFAFLSTRRLWAEKSVAAREFCSSFSHMDSTVLKPGYLLETQETGIEEAT